MQDFDECKTRKFAQLFAQKDILALEEFNNHNPIYKDLYRCIKGRVYFDKKSQFSFHMSPNQKTAIFVCMFNEPDPNYRMSGFNLEMHIIRADKYGKFHRSEQIRYDYEQNMQFQKLNDEDVILRCNKKPQQIICKHLKNLPKQLIMNDDELSVALEKERKKELLRNKKIIHFQQTQITKMANRGIRVNHH